MRSCGVATILPCRTPATSASVRMAQGLDSQPVEAPPPAACEGAVEAAGPDVWDGAAVGAPPPAGDAVGAALVCPPVVA